MKLLVVTQVVDNTHPVLSFFHRWIEEFAKYCDELHVICLQEGAHSLPEHVHVHSLGKEEGVGRLTYVRRFFTYVWKYRNNYDRVFVHMVPLYVILGAPVWRLTGKRIGLWYVHRQVNFVLRLGVFLSHVVFSSVPESMRLRNKKTEFVGHGMDLSSFVATESSSADTMFRVAHIGRITPIKHLHVLINAVAKVKTECELQVSLYGTARTTEEEQYEAALKSQVETMRLQSDIEFCGGIAHELLPNAVAKQSVTVNLTPTGGLDKSVIESAALGVPVITTNQAFAKFFDELAERYVIAFDDPEALATALLRCARRSEEEIKRESAQFTAMAQQFDITVLVPRLIAGLQS